MKEETSPRNERERKSGESQSACMRQKSEKRQRDPRAARGVKISRDVQSAVCERVREVHERGEVAKCAHARESISVRENQ